jgi:hypothetical protein
MRFFHWLQYSWRKILDAGWRLVLYEIFNFLFNYPLYGWVMFKLGLGRGWIVMATASTVQNVATFLYHEKSKVDWLFAKTARDWEKKTTKNSSKFRKIVVKITKSRDKGFVGIITFVIASLNFDPTIVAAHYRKSHFTGISRHDWGLLFSSAIIANLWWGFRMGILIEALKWLVKHF